MYNRYFNDEQIAELRTDYYKIVNNVLFNLQCRKTGNEILASIPNVGKITAYLGSSILSTSGVVLAGSIMKNIGLNPFQTGPISIMGPMLVFSGIGFAIELGRSWSQKINFTNLSKECAKKKEVLDYLCDNFSMLCKQANLDSFNFEQWIFNICEILNQKNRDGEPLSAHILNDIFYLNFKKQSTEYLKYKSKDYNDEYLKKYTIHNELLRYENILYKGFINLYNKCCGFYNMNISNNFSPIR